MRRDGFDRAWVLHTRPYRETSLLLELFSPEAGRIGAVLRGGRKPRRGETRIEPFLALSGALRGRGELRTLAQSDVVDRSPLRGQGLYAGFYLNELVVRLVEREDPQERLFAEYEGALQVLARLPADADAIGLEPVLRRFEFALLDVLGYGLDLLTDRNGDEVERTREYLVRPDAGVEPVLGTLPADALVVSGRALLAIEAGAFTDAEVLRGAKRVARAALAPHLGPRPLTSRALFAGRRGGAAGSDSGRGA